LLNLFKNGDEASHSNSDGTSFLSSSYKVLSNILPSRLTSYKMKFLGTMSVDVQYSSDTGGKVGVQQDSMSI
jgi:hypothetical protein